MREHERAVGEVEDVELDEIDPDLDRSFERAESVLPPESGGASMGDPQEAVATAKRRQILRMATTAQSSVRSPPVKTRQSSTMARASSAAGSPPRAARSASRRSSP